MNKEKNLKDRVSTNEKLSTVSGWIVVAGLIIEIGLAVMFHKHADWIENWAPVVATSLIALGVYGEIHFSGKVSKTEEELRRISDEKVSAANERAAQAELATEKLKAQFAWRSISNEKAQTLVSFLSAYGGAVTIEYVLNDPEALYFALALGKVFSSANWQVGTMGKTLGGTLVLGLFVSDSNPPQKELVRALFKIAGIEFSTADIPPSAGMSIGNSIPDSVVIFVGSKRQLAP